jgi:hypothetical protein
MHLPASQVIFAGLGAQDVHTHCHHKWYNDFNTLMIQTVVYILEPPPTPTPPQTELGPWT